MIKLFFIVNILILHFTCVSANDFQSQSTIELKSHWQFCPTKNFTPNIDISTLKCYFIDLPNPWETALKNYDGFGLLHNSFVLKNIHEKNQLSFYTLNIRDADKVYINGELIGQTGEFPPYYQKAVFYKRLYPIPINLLKNDTKNTIDIWVYNGARSGGIVNDVPIITPYKKQIKKIHSQNLITHTFIIILLFYSLFSFTNFIFNWSAKDNLFYGLFLFAWSVYLFTSSDLVIFYNISLNAMFRLNVILFFTTFLTFILFIYYFFKENIPLIVKGIIGISLAFIPPCLFLPVPEQLYPMVNVIEILVLPVAIYITWMLIKANKAHVKYAKIMSIILGMYVIFGFIEVYLDLFSANEAAKFSPFGPWMLLIISLSLTFVIGHKNMSYYQKATFDGLTGVLRFENFTKRLEKLIALSMRERNVIVVMMVDIDNFKTINDKYGHIQGDNVLVSVSNMMENELRSFDLISRYGGDEFCIAAMMHTPTDAKNFVKRFHGTIKQLKIECNQKHISVNATIGASLSSKETPISANELIKMADDLLITAKIKNKGNIMW